MDLSPARQDYHSGVSQHPVEPTVRFPVSVCGTEHNVDLAYGTNPPNGAVQVVAEVPDQEMESQVSPPAPISK